MTTESQTHRIYRQLEEKLSPKRKLSAGSWNSFVLVLCFLLGAEVVGAAYLFYSLALEIKQTQEVARLGEYPVQCLQYLVDPGLRENASFSSEDLAGCDQWNAELKKTIEKQLISDVRNALYQELTAHNVSLTHANKPAIHLGPEQGWRQFLWLKPDSQWGPMTTARGDVVRWDNVNGVAVQEGMMGYSQDVGIVVPRDGLYFVYSQVYYHSQRPAGKEQAQPFLHYIYRKTSYQEPILLSKAASTGCWNMELERDLVSSHQGALFQLQQGDQLILKVHDIHSVYLNEDSTYFGAFMVI
ncbi:TNF10 factor, partial [Atractosteus spatula]|nr:TNF10 factor [Atractosteus spatula]